MTPAKILLYCSFCGKSEVQVRKLIAGPTVFICDECVALCVEVLQDDACGGPHQGGEIVDAKAEQTD